MWKVLLDKVKYQNIRERKVIFIIKKLEKHFLGHRERLRKRASTNPKSLHDYELLELVLFSVIPRKDVKGLAKQILSLCNNNLNNFFELSKKDLEGLVGTITSEKLVSISRVLKMFYNKIDDSEIYVELEKLNSATSVLNYINRLSELTPNDTHVLLMNKKHGLMKDVVANSLKADADFIVEEALFVGASNIILVERLDIDSDYVSVSEYIKSNHKPQENIEKDLRYRSSSEYNETYHDGKIVKYRDDQNYNALIRILDKAFYLSYVFGAINIKLVDCFIILNNTRISLKYLNIV